jgi:hypothetical protein
VRIQVPVSLTVSNCEAVKAGAAACTALPGCVFCLDASRSGVLLTAASSTLSWRKQRRLGAALDGEAEVAAEGELETPSAPLSLLQRLAAQLTALLPWSLPMPLHFAHLLAAVRGGGGGGGEEYEKASNERADEQAASLPLAADGVGAANAHGHSRQLKLPVPFLPIPLSASATSSGGAAAGGATALPAAAWMNDGVCVTAATTRACFTALLGTGERSDASPARRPSFRVLAVSVGGAFTLLLSARMFR